MIPHVEGSKADLDEDELSFAIERAKQIKWYDQILLNRPLRIVVSLVIVAIITPILFYRYIFFPSIDLPPSDGFSSGSCLVPRESRLPCGIESVTPEQCHAQCCYDYNSNICFHRYPSRFSYISNGNWSENVSLNPRIPRVPYASQRSLTNIRLSIDEVSATHLSLTFYQGIRNMNSQRLKEKDYMYNVSTPELNVIVSTPLGNIFNTARGPLIASNNIWEISFTLTNESMYGLGEIPLKGDTVKILHNHKGGLDSIPLIFAKSNGSYHGLLIETQGPTEIIVRTDNHLIVRSITNVGLKFHLFVGPKPVDVMNDARNVIGSKKNLEYWMLGTHVCSELTSDTPLLDLQTFIAEANSQGLPFDSHCGVTPLVFDTECDDTLVTLVNQGAMLIRNASRKFVPHISPYIRYRKPPENDDISNEDNEIAKTFDDRNRCFNDELYEQYYIRDPASEHSYRGLVDEHEVIYPSYDTVTENFMQDLWVYDTDFEGVILENNWPLDESEKEVKEIQRYLPYFNENIEAAFQLTPQWNATRPLFNTTSHPNATETMTEKYIYAHNEYGNHFSAAFQKIKGPIPSFSTSQWMNGDVMINRHDVPTSWANLQKEIIDASLGGISGHWYWSSPICGDTKLYDNVTQVRLCAKWYMAATYMPMIKIYSKEVKRDPISFAGTERMHMITALTRRISLLPYFYTVLQEGPLLRPMFYQFPTSHNLTDIITQFSVGADLLIVPNLQPSQTHVHFWVPPGSWYEFWSGMKITAEEGTVVTMTTTEADFLTLARGGSIVVIQKDVQLTAELTRLHSAYSLIMALHCETEIFEQNSTTGSTITTGDTSNDVNSNENGINIGETLVSTTIEATDETNKDEDIITTTEPALFNITTCIAFGKLYMTENISIIFEANANKLKITGTGEDYDVFCSITEAKWSRSIKEIAIYGLDRDRNNYDDKRLVTTSIDLCQLQTNDEIVFEYDA